MATLGISQRRPGVRRPEAARPKVRVSEGVGMESSAVDLDPQDLLHAHVAQLDLGSEVIDERELTGLVGGLEQHRLEAERIGEAIGLAASNCPGAENRPTSCALSRASTTRRTAPASSQR